MARSQPTTPALCLWPGVRRFRVASRHGQHARGRIQHPAGNVQRHHGHLRPGGGSTSHFGFWVWCDAGSTSSYGDCQGSIYFYSLAPNAVPVTGSVQPQGDGAYRMTVTSPPSRGFPGGVACTLTNIPPVTSGPANEVTATCTSPAGTGTALNGVVAISKA